MLSKLKQFDYTVLVARLVPLDLIMGQPLVYGLRQPSKPEIFILHKFRKKLVEEKKNIY